LRFAICDLRFLKSLSSRAAAKDLAQPALPPSALASVLLLVAFHSPLLFNLLQYQAIKL